MPQVYSSRRGTSCGNETTGQECDRDVTRVTPIEVLTRTHWTNSTKLPLRASAHELLRFKGTPLLFENVREWRT